MNTHVLQGTTASRAIGVLDSRETNLTNGRLFLVNISRVRDGIELIMDNRTRVENALERNPWRQDLGARDNRQRNPVATRHRPAATPHRRTLEKRLKGFRRRRGRAGDATEGADAANAHPAGADPARA